MPQAITKPSKPKRAIKSGIEPIKRGGARKGSGRRAIYGEAMPKRNIRLSDEHWDKLVTLGKGNAADAIRDWLDGIPA